MDDNLVKKEAWQQHTNALIDDIKTVMLSHDKMTAYIFQTKNLTLLFGKMYEQE